MEGMANEPGRASGREGALALTLQTPSPRPGDAEGAPGRGLARAGARRGPAPHPFAITRPHRTVAATHALHGLCPEGARGSTAATRKYTLEPDGEAPASVYLVFVHAMGAEYVVASAALVAC